MCCYEKNILILIYNVNAMTQKLIYIYKIYFFTFMLSSSGHKLSNIAPLQSEVFQTFYLNCKTEIHNFKYIFITFKNTNLTCFI